MKAQVIVKLNLKLRSPEGEIVMNEAGDLVRCVEADTHEECRQTFQQVRNDVIDGIVRFYLTPDGDPAVILSRTGEWEGFKKPKGSKRMFPTQIKLVVEGEEGFDQQRWDDFQNATKGGK
jgi:hypothetical protein